MLGCDELAVWKVFKMPVPLMPAGDDPDKRDEATKTVYSVMVALALLSGLVSLRYHIRLAWLLRQVAAAHLDEAAPATPRSADKAMLTKLKWEVDRSRREVTSHTITLLSVAIEDVSYACQKTHVCSVRARKSGLHERSVVACAYAAAFFSHGQLCRYR
jgi:hypothetical protein